MECIFAAHEPLEKMNHDSQKHMDILPLQGSCFAGRFTHKQTKKLAETVRLRAAQ